MKNLYESILSSTKTGDYIVLEKIKEWAESCFAPYLKEIINISAEKIDKKMYAVISRKTKLDYGEKAVKNFELNPEKIQKMPKGLSGILYKYKFSEKDYVFYPLSIEIFGIQNGSLDLSGFDYTGFKEEKYDDPFKITLRNFFNTSIKGLPKTAKPFRLEMDGGFNIWLDGLKAPEVEVYTVKSGFDIEKTKNSYIKSIVFSAYVFTRTSNYSRPYTYSGKYGFFNSFSAVLEKFTNENKVSHIYYEAPKKRMELSYEDLPGVVKAGKLEIIKGHKYDFYMNPVKNFK